MIYCESFTLYVKLLLVIRTYYFIIILSYYFCNHGYFSSILLNTYNCLSS